MDESCPRYVMMGRPQHGLGHQMGTFTTALITALYFNLTLVDSGFRDDSTSRPQGPISTRKKVKPLAGGHDCHDL